MRQFTDTADFMRQQEIIDSINRYDFKNVYELADAQTYGSNIREISKIFEIATATSNVGKAPFFQYVP